jgi:hypothetical protein
MGCCTSSSSKSDSTPPVDGRDRWATARSQKELQPVVEKNEKGLKAASSARLGKSVAQSMYEVEDDVAASACLGKSVAQSMYEVEDDVAALLTQREQNQLDLKVGATALNAKSPGEKQNQQDQQQRDGGVQAQPLQSYRSADVGALDGEVHLELAPLSAKETTGTTRVDPASSIHDVHHLLKQDEIWLLNALFRYYASHGVSRNILRGLTGSQLQKMLREAHVVPNLLSGNRVDLRFQKYRYGGSSAATAALVSPRSNASSVDVNFTLASPTSRSRKGRRELDFASFIDICADLALEIYPAETHGDTDATLSHFLERCFVDLAVRISETGTVRKANGHVSNLADVGQKKTKARRRSTVSEAASLLNGFIDGTASRSSGSGGGLLGGDCTEPTESKDDVIAVSRLLDLYEKPLRCVFKFYCTLTKVAPRNEHGIPANVVRTHLTFKDTTILLKDFHVVPARLGNRQLQDVFHSTKLGRKSDSKYLNWMSFNEWRVLMVNISKLDISDDAGGLVEKLGRLLASMDHGVGNMQKRGSGILPRFTAVEKSLA